ncbi:hypothetical protein AVEN_35934-1, partial [Araneus ventricosus]
MENGDKEDDDDDTTDPPSQYLLISQDQFSLQSVQSLRAFFSSLSFTNDDHFRALDS